MTRICRDTFGYIFVIALCVLLLAWAIPNYTPAYPGYGAPPALVPIVAVCVMLVMACVSLVRVFVAKKFNRQIPAAEREFPEDLADGGGFTQVGRVNLVHLASIMTPCVLFLAVIDHVGYIPSSLVFLLALQFIIGSRRWVQSAMVSVVLTTALYVAMRYGFGVPVPGPQLF